MGQGDQGRAHRTGVAIVDPATAPGPGFGWVVVLCRNLAPVFRPHRRALATVLLLMLLELALQLGQRKAFTTLIDDAILQKEIGLMVLILGLLLSAAVISSVCGSLHEYILSGLCAVIPAEARTRLFHHVQGMPLEQLRSATHGDLVSRIVNDAGGLESALWSLGFVATSLCGVAIALGMLLSTDWRLALLGIVLLLPTIPLGPRLLTPRAEQASYASKDAYGRLSTQLWENLANQVVIRVFGMGRFARARFSQVNEEISHFTRTYNLYSYFSNRLPWIAVELIEVIVLAAGCWMLVRGDITTGGLVAFYLLFSALATHAYSFASSFSRLVGVSASMRRMQALQAAPAQALQAATPQAPPGSPPGQPLDPPPGQPLDPADFLRHDAVSGMRKAPQIVFDAVSFRYPRWRARDTAADTDRTDDLTGSSKPGAPEDGDQIHGLSLCVGRGELCAFVGTSGSGKSTAVQLLLGLLHPREGRVLVDGKDLRSIPLTPYWASTSAVFQDSLLFHTSIAENIRAAFPAASDAQVSQALAAAGLADWIGSLPEGFNTHVSADTCSGGQRQRIAIARALVRDPTLLVLDEPTSALDAATGRAVNETLLRVMGQRTTVLVTHQLRNATHANQIVVFDRGRAVERGRHEELLGAGGVYRSLWDQQEQGWRGRAA